MDDDLATRLAPSGALLATNIALSAAIDRCAVDGMDHDSTSIDLLVRLSLAEGGRLRAVELSDQLLLSPSHVSRMLDRSEKAGLVRREPDPDDRRASQVVMTDEGRSVVERFAPRLSSVLDRTVHHVLDKSEIATLVGMLERVERAARECMPNP
ncbi:MAG: MarR family transcriptional regulator [Actinomycetota bacterium]